MGYYDYYDSTVLDYKQTCLELSKSNFDNFKQNKKYRIMLEGGPKIQGEYYLNQINNHNKKNIFYNNLDKFFVNDKIGNPDIHNFGNGIECSITSLKYTFNILNILELLDGETVKNIVEVGPGYGGLSIIFDSLYDFDTVNFIDLKEANSFNKKYIKKFKNFEKKCKFNTSESYKEIDWNEVDLVIAVNSFTECDTHIQLEYYKKLISKSKFSYVVRNYSDEKTRRDHQLCKEILDDNFLIDDSEVVERSRDNIIVYIKKIL